jgi:hypothetical protein
MLIREHIIDTARGAEVGLGVALAGCLFYLRDRIRIWEFCLRDDLADYLRRRANVDSMPGPGIAKRRRSR